MWLVILVVVLVVLTLIGGYALWIEPNWLRIRHHVLRLENWDPALDGLTVLHLSDLHFGRATSRATRFIRRASSVPSDLVVITGDFISGPGSLRRCTQALQQLTAHRDVFGVLGNHEYRVYHFSWPFAGPFRRAEPLDTPGIVRELEHSGVVMLVKVTSRQVV